MYRSSAFTRWHRERNQKISRSARNHTYGWNGRDARYKPSVDPITYTVRRLHSVSDKRDHLPEPVRRGIHQDSRQQYIHQRQRLSHFLGTGQILILILLSTFDVLIYGWCLGRCLMPWSMFDALVDVWCLDRCLMPWSMVDALVDVWYNCRCFMWWSCRFQYDQTCEIVSGKVFPFRLWNRTLQVLEIGWNRKITWMNWKSAGLWPGYILIKY